MLAALFHDLGQARDRRFQPGEGAADLPQAPHTASARLAEGGPSARIKAPIMGRRLPARAHPGAPPYVPDIPLSGSCGRGGASCENSARRRPSSSPTCAWPTPWPRAPTPAWRHHHGAESQPSGRSVQPLRPLNRGGPRHQRPRSHRRGLRGGARDGAPPARPSSTRSRKTPLSISPIRFFAGRARLPPLPQNRGEKETEEEEVAEG